MSMSLTPFHPKNGKKLRVLVIARVSDLKKQDKRSWDDQRAFCEPYIAERYRGQKDFELIKDSGSGEYLDRREYLRAIAAIETGKYDVVICEDLGRILRRAHAILFCELCEDCETRFIAINDTIDTASDNWRLNAFFAGVKHEMANRDTSNRIKRTLRNRFEQFGGDLPSRLIYGVIKPPGTASDADLRKDPKAESIYDQWFRMLERDATYQEVADWLNQERVPTGPNCKGKRWTAKAVRRLTFNSWLKGERFFGRFVSKRTNRTGRRRSVKAPLGHERTRFCPNLVFIDPERYDRLIARLKKRSKRGSNSVPSKKVITRFHKKTSFPGQHLRCGICNRYYYWGGNGSFDGMSCSGALDYRCWNGFTVQGFEASKKIANLVLETIEALPGFDQTISELMRSKLDIFQDEQKSQASILQTKLSQIQNELENVSEAIAQCGFSSALATKLKKLEDDKLEVQAQIHDLEADVPSELAVPTLEELKKQVRHAMSELAVDSREFGLLMRRLLPDLKAYPYQLIGSNSFGMRIHCTLNVASLLPKHVVSLGINDLIQKKLVLNLCTPPKRELLRPEIIALKKQGCKSPEIIQKLKCSIALIDRASRLQRLMEEKGFTDPYVILTEPPLEYKTLSRFRHSRYHFDPLPEQDS